MFYFLLMVVNRDHSSKLLSFWENCVYIGCRQTDKQMDSIDAKSRRRNNNKCIGDDTKAAARQSPNCINKTKKIWRKTIFNMADEFLHPARGSGSWQWIHQLAAPCNVACGSGIMTVNSPGGSTLQCGRWLLDDMPLNSPKCRSYLNSTSGFDFGHITAVEVSFCTSLRNFIQIGPPSAEKKWRHVNFQDGGSPPSWILGVQ